MTAYLLDVNVLIALSWPGHKFHSHVQRWFAHHASKGWATCPIVEAGFVRILSNPAFSPRAVSPKEAIRALSINVQHPAYQFWPDDVSLVDLKIPIIGHKQATDAYLLGLAIRHRGKLATMDRGIWTLRPEEVEMIR